MSKTITVTYEVTVRKNDLIDPHDLHTDFDGSWESVVAYFEREESSLFLIVNYPDAVRRVAVREDP